jgi:hypothetical protein
MLLSVVFVACRRDDTTPSIRPPVDPPTKPSASVSAPVKPAPSRSPPDFAMVAIVEGDPFASIVLPAGATLEADAVATSRFVRFPIGTGATIHDGCDALMKLVARSSTLAPGVIVVCGEDRHAPVGAVRSWMVDPTPLLSRADVLRAEIRYDEDVLPLHGHVVCELAPASVKRWNAWAKAHPKVRIALQVGPDVIDVDDVGPALMTGGELWITPKRPFAMSGNDDATKALAAAMSGDAGVP